MKRILHLADLHFGRTGPDAIECIHRFIAEQGGKLDLVVMAGDWTQRARAWQFGQAREFIARVPVPVLSIPGNHDVSLFNLFARFLFPFRGYAKYIRPVTRESFSSSEVAVFGISTVNRFSVADGRLDKWEIAKAKDFFQSAPAGTLRILCTHHPLYQRGSEEWMPGSEILAELGVNILLAGHVHRHSVGMAALGEQKILSIVSGTSASDRLRGESNGFHLLEIEGRSVRVKSYTLEKAGFISSEGPPNSFEL